MGSDGATGCDPAVRAEVVHESGRTRIARLVLPAGGTVIRKEPLGADGERSENKEVERARQNVRDRVSSHGVGCRH